MTQIKKLNKELIEIMTLYKFNKAGNWFTLLDKKASMGLSAIYVNVHIL